MGFFARVVHFSAEFMTCMRPPISAVVTVLEIILNSFSRWTNVSLFKCLMVNISVDFMNIRIKIRNYFLNVFELSRLTEIIVIRYIMIYLSQR